jgi:hypothetical protein
MRYRVFLDIFLFLFLAKVVHLWEAFFVLVVGVAVVGVAVVGVAAAGMRRPQFVQLL